MSNKSYVDLLYAQSHTSQGSRPRGHRQGGGQQMTAHTPGPWRAENRNTGTRAVFMPDDTIVIRNSRLSGIAYLYKTNFDIDGRIDAANARLIAAAPEMLDALKTVQQWLNDGSGDLENSIDKIVATAIAKAEGGI